MIGKSKTDELEAEDISEASERAAEEAPAAPPQDTRRAEAESLVNGWVRSRLANSPISRDLNAWHHLQAALPELVSAILERG